MNQNTTRSTRPKTHIASDALVIIRLAFEDQCALANALENPPEPVPALRRACEAHRRLVVKTR